MTTSHRSELLCSGTIPDFSNNTALYKLQMQRTGLSGTSTTMSSNHSWYFVAGPVPDFSKNTALQSLSLNNNELTGTSNYDHQRSYHLIFCVFFIFCQVQFLTFPSVYRCSICFWTTISWAVSHYDHQPSYLTLVCQELFQTSQAMLFWETFICMPTSWPVSRLRSPAIIVDILLQVQFQISATTVPTLLCRAFS